MTLDGAICHAEEVADEKEKEAYNWEYNYDMAVPDTIAECKECAAEHRQLAEWLRELKQLREQSKWVPVSKRLPEPQKHGDEDLSDWVETTTLIGKNKDAYVVDAYYCFSENKWYSDRFVIGGVFIGEVVAWRPLPEPYKTESEEKE